VNRKNVKPIRLFIKQLSTFDIGLSPADQASTAERIGTLALRQAPESRASKAAPALPGTACRLMANVWMLYEERQIDKGWEFYEESKQEVSLLRKADPPRPAEVVSADDVSPALWSIQIVPSPETPPSNDIHLSAFSDPRSAMDLGQPIKI
jgi:hypothetical protein